MLNIFNLGRINFSIQRPPAKERRWFISHAYDDVIYMQQCLDALPPEAKPMIFSPIQVPPTKFVSTKLLDVISLCDGLVYFSGGQSDRSFWVAFEKDFAKRKNLEVYNFNVTDRTVSRDDNPARRLPIFASYNQLGGERYERERVAAIVDWMAKERNFELFNPKAVRDDNWYDDVTNDARSRLAAGGYFLFFITSKISAGMK